MSEFGQKKRKAREKACDDGASRSEDEIDEYDELFERLSYRQKSVKEIESTDGFTETFAIPTTLPSFFCYYPAAKRRAVELKQGGKPKEAVLLMRACIRFIKTGDKTDITKQLPSFGAGQSSQDAVDLSKDGKDAASAGEPRVMWDVCAGDEGWFEFGPRLSALVDAAYLSGKKRLEFTGNMGLPYSVDLERMQQKNEMTGTMRPIRRNVTYPGTMGI